MSAPGFAEATYASSSRTPSEAVVHSSRATQDADSGTPSRSHDEMASAVDIRRAEEKREDKGPPPQRTRKTGCPRKRGVSE